MKCAVWLLFASSAMFAQSPATPPSPLVFAESQLAANGHDLSCYDAYSLVGEGDPDDWEFLFVPIDTECSYGALEMSVSRRQLTGDDREAPLLMWHKPGQSHDPYREKVLRKAIEAVEPQIRKLFERDSLDIDCEFVRSQAAKVADLRSLVRFNVRETLTSHDVIVRVAPTDSCPGQTGIGQDSMFEHSVERVETRRFSPGWDD